MFIVLLKFSANRHLAGRFMDGHNTWLQNGFDDGVFLLAGSLDSGKGGALLANGPSRDALQHRVNADPFVTEGVVTAEIQELTPNRTDERLAFLLPLPVTESGDPE